MPQDDTDRGLQRYLWNLCEEALRAPTRQAIEDRVCQGVQAHDGVSRVWVCDSPPESSPRTVAGQRDAEVDRFHADWESAAADAPWTRAADDKTVVIEPVPESLGDAETTVVSVPLHHRRINYGVLNLASDPDGQRAFGSASEVWSTFGHIVGHALATGEMQSHGEIFRQAIEQAEPAFAILDDAGTIEYANAGFESTFGYRKSQTVGSTLSGLVDGIPNEVLAEVDQSGSWREEVLCRRRNGREIHVDLSIAAVPVEGGTKSRYVAAGTDITPLREREQRLEVVNRVLRHNLRNDLQSIRGYIEMAADADEQPADESLDAALRKTRDLLTTAETSRNIQQTLAETERFEQDLCRALRNALERVRETYPEEDLQVSMPDSVDVLATRGLEDALWELLENACVHGADPIEVRVVQEADEVIVEIADHGPGLPSHELTVIESGEETPLEHGSGLGLWYAHWVVNASIGDLDFDSTAGTTVRLSLDPGPRD